MITEINNQGMFIPKDLLNKDIIKKIKSDLNVSPENQFVDYNVKTYKVYKIKPNIGITVPIYYGLGFNMPYIINFPEENITQNFENNSITLRKGTQESTYDKCIKEFDKPFGGGIITLTTASGKTITFLKIMCHSKKKTLIIVNKIELMNQWKSEIKKFIPDVKIGTIQGPVFDVQGKDIVIGMLQTIAMKETITYFNFTFNTLTVIDEVHNISSEVFSKIIFKVRSKYMFGLTATLERKDKLEKMIYWYIGDILYSNISNEKKDATEIHTYRYLGESSIPLTLKDNETPACSAMVTNIANDRQRNDIIIGILADLSKNKNRHILVISDRVSQLKYLSKQLPNSALFIGTMKSEELNTSKESQILLATYKLAGEGFSLAKLNCLVFATSRANVNQAIGRIYRKKHEIAPIIVDIYDDFSYFRSQYYRRRKIYKELISNCIFKNIGGGVQNVEQSSEIFFESDTDSEM